MARIQTYVQDSNITDDDIVLGTDGDDSNKTKNYTVGGLKTHISERFEQKGYRVVSSSGNLVLGDYTLDCDTIGLTITLFDATTTDAEGRIYNICNSSGGEITVNTTSSQTVYLPRKELLSGQFTSVVLSDGESLTIQCTGSNWRSL